jgi:N-acetylmuramoyl-L-alanine amidase
MIYQGAKRYPVQGLVIHCTATPSDWRKDDTSAERVEAIRQMHIRERGWRDIGYHWLIDRDGTVLPGRPETQIGAHVAGHNTGTIGISLFGGITSKPRDLFGRNFTEAQRVALVARIQDIKQRTKLLWIKGHNEFDSGKACPGFWVPSWLLSQRLAV